MFVGGFPKFFLPFLLTFEFMVFVVIIFGLTLFDIVFCFVCSLSNFEVGGLQVTLKRCKTS